MAIDQKAIEEHIRGILTALGDDPQREGLADTPARVARMYAEMFEGMNYTNDEIADMFCKTFEEESEFCESDQDMVVVRDIEIFSHCEHHLALMYDMSVTVAYVPAGRVIGLSKLKDGYLMPTAIASLAAVRQYYASLAPLRGFEMLPVRSITN